MTLPGHERGCWMREGERDAQGRFVTGPVPSCGGTFVCAKCKRTVGWCRGCADDLPDLCAACWQRETHARAGATGEAGR